MPKIVFLLEERSMKNTLAHILPKVLPGTFFQLIPHEGKSHLKKSISAKLKGWQEKDVYFVILLDQDSSDCVQLKNELLELSKSCGRVDTMIRIVCRELESWFLGDFNAIEKAFDIDLSKIRNKSKYRNPDELMDAKEVLKAIIKYQPLDGSNRIAKHMDVDQNKSHSFNIFIDGLKRLNKQIS